MFTLFFLYSLVALSGYRYNWQLCVWGHTCLPHAVSIDQVGGVGVGGENGRYKSEAALLRRQPISPGPGSSRSGSADPLGVLVL